jgi:hypothetical protein
LDQKWEITRAFVTTMTAFRKELDTVSGMFKPKNHIGKATTWKQVSSQVAQRKKHEGKGLIEQTLKLFDQSSDAGSNELNHGWTLEWYVH